MKLFKALRVGFAISWAQFAWDLSLIAGRQPHSSGSASGGVGIAGLGI